MREKELNKGTKKVEKQMAISTEDSGMMASRLDFRNILSLLSALAAIFMVVGGAYYFIDNFIDKKIETHAKVFKTFKKDNYETKIKDIIKNNEDLRNSISKIKAKNIMVMRKSKLGTIQQENLSDVLHEFEEKFRQMASKNDALSNKIEILENKSVSLDGTTWRGKVGFFDYKGDDAICLLSTSIDWSQKQTFNTANLLGERLSLCFYKGVNKSKEFKVTKMFFPRDSIDPNYFAIRIPKKYIDYLALDKSEATRIRNEGECDGFITFLQSE